MNIAVLLTGELREFELAQRSWGPLRDLNADFYVSTWDISIQKNDYFEIDLVEEVTTEKIKKYLPDAKISILNQENFIPGCRDTEIWAININKLIFHWKNCLELVKKSDKNYDTLILMRPDVFFLIDDSKTFLNCNNNKAIYGTKHITITGLNKEAVNFEKNINYFDYFVFDIFFMGNYDVMKNFIEMCPNNLDKRVHHKLGEHILSLGYYVEIINNFKAVVVRPISRNLKEINFDFTQLSVDHAEWNKHYKL